MAVRTTGRMPFMTLTEDNSIVDLLVSDPLPPSSVAYLEARILAKNQADSNLLYTKLRYVFRRDGAAAAVWQGGNSHVVDSVGGTWYADADAIDNSIHVYVNGAAATTIEWWADVDITIMQLASAM